MLFVHHHEPAVQQDGSSGARGVNHFFYEDHKTYGRPGNVTSGIPIRKNEMLHCACLFTRLKKNRYYVSNIFERRHLYQQVFSAIRYARFCSVLLTQTPPNCIVSALRTLCWFEPLDLELRTTNLPF